MPRRGWPLWGHPNSGSSSLPPRLGGGGGGGRGPLPGPPLPPPDRLALVLGKFATVFTLATTSVVLVVGTVILSLRLAPLSAAPTSLSGGAVVSLVGAGLVFAAF